MEPSKGREEGLLVFRGKDIRDGKRVFRGRDMINGGGVKRMILELLKSPIVTEKSVGLLEKNQYTFDVDVKLTKPQIKRLIQELFQVEVKAINTHRPPRKKRGRGHMPACKRAIITVKSGYSLPLFKEKESTS